MYLKREKQITQKAKEIPGTNARYIFLIITAFVCGASILIWQVILKLQKNKCILIPFRCYSRVISGLPNMTYQMELFLRTRRTPLIMSLPAHLAAHGKETNDKKGKKRNPL